MTSWTAEELRRAALDALGDHADERARDALRHGEIAIASGVASWTASDGPVAAHRVTLALDAARLARLRATPALLDALVAAFAGAIARRQHESLHELALRWSPAAHAVAAGYRDVPPLARAQSLHDALVDYLEVVGEPDLARIVARADLASPPGPEDEVQIVLRGTGAPPPSAREIAAVTRAVRDLLGDDRARAVLRAR